AVLDSYRHNPDVHSAWIPAIDFLVPNLGADALCKPVHCAPFNNVHFRRALLYAIDRWVIAQKIFHGWEMPLCGLIPKGVLGYEGHELITQGHTVLWVSMAALVQRLLAAKRDLRLPQELAKLDR